jgi:nucleotide-binding universal stress UspA family protein
MGGAIVVGVDGSDSGADALALGVRLARATGDPLIVAAIYPEESQDPLGRVDAEWVAVMRGQAEETLAQARELVGEQLRADYRAIGSSSPAHGLADLADAEQASMLVVGSHRHCARRRSLPGSTGERLLQGAASPVAVAPRGLHQRGSGEIRSIGCAFADTPDGHEALRAAAALAHRTSAELKVYSAIGSRAEFSSVMLWRTDDEAILARSREQHQVSLDAALARVPAEVRATGELLEGEVVEALSALDDRDIDLLVCGSRGYGPVRRVLLGGVSSRLIRRAGCPIVVVPRSAAEPLEGAARHSGRARRGA